MMTVMDGLCAHGFEIQYLADVLSVEFDAAWRRRVSIHVVRLAMSIALVGQ